MSDALQPGRTEAGTTDPRILRSRQMLMEALFNLVKRKEFDEISVQEIADEATLNRATFYLHYPDKNALLQAMTAARFRDLVAQRGLSFSDCNGGLHAIALGVCDFLAKSGECRMGKRPLESSIVPAVESIFHEGANKHEIAPGVDPELLASTAAWAIFGAALRWYETPSRISAEEMAARIETMVKPIFDTHGGTLKGGKTDGE